MRINTTQTDKLTIRDTEVENVEQFTYLGSIISTTGGTDMRTPVSSTNKTDCHDIVELLLKVALNIITLTLTHIVSACHFTSVHTSIYYFCTSAGGLESMFNSTMSMTSSLKIAEDCLKRTRRYNIMYVISSLPRYATPGHQS
jgi:hypothetical protein